MKTRMRALTALGICAVEAKGEERLPPNEGTAMVADAASIPEDTAQ